MTAPSPHAERAFRRLAVATAVAALVLVALGGAVRATDSGLACPTWPGCFSAGDFLPGPDLHVWLEHSHRLLAGVVGLGTAGLAVMALLRFRRRPLVLWATLGAAVAVLVQAGLGALVVLRLLRAELVTAHLGLGMAVVGVLVALALGLGAGRAVAGRRDLRLARASAGVAALTYVQILVGGHLTGVGAGLAFVEGFPFLGLAALGPVTSQGAGFNVAHRVLAVALVVAVAVLVRRARALGATGWTARLPQVAAGLVGVQVLIGVGNLVSGLSWATVIPHLAVASWIWAVLVAQTVLAARTVPAAPAAAPPAERGAPALHDAGVR